MGFKSLTRLNMNYIRPFIDYIYIIGCFPRSYLRETQVVLQLFFHVMMPLISVYVSYHKNWHLAVFSGFAFLRDALTMISLCIALASTTFTTSI